MEKFLWLCYKYNEDNAFYNNFALNIILLILGLSVL